MEMKSASDVKRSFPMVDLRADLIFFHSSQLSIDSESNTLHTYRLTLLNLVGLLVVVLQQQKVFRDVNILMQKCKKVHALQ